MKINFNADVLRNKDKRSILLNDRWEMFDDGVIYDTEKAKDIPDWIFEFRNFVLENYKTMKHQIEK